jgi:Domain of unknown function (DUF6456)
MPAGWSSSGATTPRSIACCDVWCFLKRPEDVERERLWPARSAKVALQLALDRLARHYGYAAELQGRAKAGVRTWLAEGAEFSVDGV